MILRRNPGKGLAPGISSEDTEKNQDNKMLELFKENVGITLSRFAQLCACVQANISNKKWAELPVHFYLLLLYHGKTREIFLKNILS